MSDLSNFRAALEGVASSDYERARRLGIPRKTIELWRKSPPDWMRRLVQHRELAEALAADARACETQQEVA